MADRSPEPSAPERPTHIRYLVVALTTLSAVLLYLDRFCISFAERYIKEDLGLSDTQIGWMFSAFFLSYALAQVPSGFLSDRFGARRMLTLYILLWSLFTGLTGLAAGLIVLLVLRLSIGIAQAGAYPTAGGLISKWVTFQARGLASSLVAVGGRVGLFIAPVLTAYLIVLFVPRSVSSLLEPRDVLDYPRLCYRLSEPLQEPVAIASALGHTGPFAEPLPAACAIMAEDLAGSGERLLERLPESTRATVRAIASGYAAALAEQRRRKVSLERVLEDKPLPRTSPAQREAVVGELNDLLRRPDLFKPSQLDPAMLPREAKALLDRLPSGLDESEIERLNRLLLEVAYPREVRKVYGAGWRPVMFVYGLAGLVVAALFWFWFRDRPDLHPRCNAAEVELIENSRPAGTPSPYGRARAVPLGRLCASGSMWLMCLAQMGTNIGWVFLGTWLPRYLEDVHRLPIELRGILAAVPLLVGWFGMVGGGWLTDHLTRKLGSRWGRALPLTLSRFVAMGAYLVCLLDLGPYAVTAAFAVVAFATDLGSAAVWAYGQDVGGRYAGSVLGWGNMWGNLGAALAPPLLIWVVGGGGWQAAFLTCAAAFLASGLCSLGINASVPIAPPEEEATVEKR